MVNFKVYYTKAFVFGRILLSLILFAVSTNLYFEFFNINSDLLTQLSTHKFYAIIFIGSFILSLVIFLNAIYCARYKITVDGGHIVIRKLFTIKKIFLFDIKVIYIKEENNLTNNIRCKTDTLTFTFYSNKKPVKFTSNMINYNNLYAHIYSALYYKNKVSTFMSYIWSIEG